MNTYERVGALSDFAADCPEGFTITEAALHLGCTAGQARAAIRRLRILFGDDDTINLICEPGGQYEQWRYRFVGTFDDARGWIANRTNDCESRLKTVQAIASSITAATDGRTWEGKRAKKIARTLGFLIEELADIDERAS